MPYLHAFTSFSWFLLSLKGIICIGLMLQVDVQTKSDRTEQTSKSVSTSPILHLDFIHDPVTEHKLFIVTHGPTSRLRFRSPKLYIGAQALIDGLDEIGEIELLVILQRRGEQFSQASAPQCQSAEDATEKKNSRRK